MLSVCFTGFGALGWGSQTQFRPYTSQGILLAPEVSLQPFSCQLWGPSEPSCGFLSTFSTSNIVLKLFLLSMVIRLLSCYCSVVYFRWFLHNLVAIPAWFWEEVSVISTHSSAILDPLGWRSFSVKGQVVNTSGFLGHIHSLLLLNFIFTKENELQSILKWECGYVSIKLYLQKQAWTEFGLCAYNLIIPALDQITTISCLDYCIRMMCGNCHLWPHLHFGLVSILMKMSCSVILFITWKVVEKWLKLCVVILNFDLSKWSFEEPTNTNL